MIIPRILLIAARKKLVDMPDKRKIHKDMTPRLGGVSFFPTIIFTFCFVLAVRILIQDVQKVELFEYFVREFMMLVCGMTLLYLIGIADDLIGVRYRQKFVIQILCASFFPLAGLWINNLYGVFGIYEIPAYVGMPFTVFICVLITNAINLIDGIDGLASGLSGATLLVFGTLFLMKGLWVYSLFAAATFGVLGPFFYYNVFGGATRSRKIFMGDTGSLTLGYVLSFLTIKFCMYNSEFMSYTEGAVVIAFGALLIPVCDAIRVACVRMRDGKSPFEPDKNHIHHKCLDIGLSPKRTMLLLILIAICFSITNIMLVKYLDQNLIILIDLLLWLGLNWYLNRLKACKSVLVKTKLSKKKSVKRRIASKVV